MTTFDDHFSGHADLYNRYRPRYPDELYQWLSEQTQGHERAWDCATGGGQAAVGLTSRYERVIGTDASPQQLANATRHEGVSYLLASAEAMPVRDSSVDLVTVAQALHWLEHDAFYAEVRRIGRPGGIIAAWSYQLFSVDADIDAVMKPFYHDLLDPYWPPERAHVRSHYDNLPFPFDEIDAPATAMHPTWTRLDLLNQVSTWSAVRRHDAATGRSAVDILAPHLEEVWPQDDERQVTWKINFRVGRL